MENSAGKSTVRRFLAEVIGAGNDGLLNNVAAAGYRPHTAALAGVPVLPAGREALRARLRQTGALPNQVFRMVQDGDLVFAQVRYDGPPPVAGADIFRLDADGLIAEHWNCRQPMGQDAATGADRFGGGGSGDLPTGEARRLDMKRVMRAVLLDMWGKGNAALVPVFYDEGYVQHNPDMPGGYHRIKQIVENEIAHYIAATGGDYPVEIHRIGAEGDLIFVHYSIFMAGIGRNEGARSTNTDIFRISAANKMIEHWDVLQIERDPLPDDATLF